MDDLPQPVITKHNKPYGCRRHVWDPQISRQIGQFFFLKRKQNKIKVKEITSFIGVSREQLHKYETGVNQISIGLFLKLCCLFKIQPDSALREALGPLWEVVMK